MKFTKFAAVSALTLALAGTGIVPAMADEKEAVQQESINTNTQEDGENIANHEEYYGSDSWKWVRSTLASYINQPLVGGEFKNSFQVGSSNYDIRYNIANRGSSTLNWKIYTPAGNIWNSGTVKPGESKTYTAWADFDFIPVGEYKISIISSNGGPGAFDFAARSLN